MHKIDSFFRESQRVDATRSCPLNSLAESRVLTHYFLFPVRLIRVALCPFTFSNGVTVPAGTLVGVPAAAIHTDEGIYPNPEEFDGFRFVKLRERDGDAGHLATSTSWDHLDFGYGRHAW